MNDIINNDGFDGGTGADSTGEIRRIAARKVLKNGKLDVTTFLAKQDVWYLFIWGDGSKQILWAPWVVAAKGTLEVGRVYARAATGIYLIVPRSLRRITVRLGSSWTCASQSAVVNLDRVEWMDLDGRTKWLGFNKRGDAQPPSETEAVRVSVRNVGRIRRELAMFR